MGTKSKAREYEVINFSLSLVLSEKIFDFSFGFLSTLASLTKSTKKSTKIEKCLGKYSASWVMGTKQLIFLPFVLSEKKFDFSFGFFGTLTLRSKSTKKKYKLWVPNVKLGLRNN